jgi:integrase/recombinase XerD
MKDMYQDFLLSKQLQGVSPSTLEAYDWSIRRLLDFCPDPDASDIRRWLTSLDVSNVTLATYIRRLRTFFTWCCEEGYIAISPMTHIPTPICPDTQPKAIPDASLAKLITVARKNKRSLAIVLLFLDSSLRATELANLKRSDIDLDNGVLQVIHGKGGKSGLAYFSPVTARAIRVYLATRKDDDPILFLSQRKQPMNRGSLRLLMYRLCEQAGIEKISCHALRHTSASNMARSGIGAFELKELLRHSDIRISQRYVWLSGQAVKEAHSKFSPVVSLVR